MYEFHPRVIAFISRRPLMANPDVLSPTGTHINRKLWRFDDYLFAYNEAFPSIVLTQELLKGGQLSWQGFNVSSFARFLWEKKQSALSSPRPAFPSQEKN